MCVCGERFVITYDLCRHRYIAALSHLETIVQLRSGSDSQLSLHATCCISLFDGQHSGSLQKFCSVGKSYS